MDFLAEEEMRGPAVLHGGDFFSPNGLEASDDQ